MVLVNRRERRRLVERQAEHRLARSPDHSANTVLGRRGEDVVRRHRVVAEGLAGRADIRSWNRREVDHGLRPGEELMTLAEVGEVGNDALSVRTAVVRHVDIQHVVSVLAQLPHDPPPALAASAGHDHPHRRILLFDRIMQSYAYNYHGCAIACVHSIAPKELASP